ncbi:MAG TPA: hypothetical protein ENI82_04080, partial [Bacteroidetes bacterium]|nr:hypothetical protein [Bacteroidota bacterium]
MNTYNFNKKISFVFYTVVILIAMLFSSGKTSGQAVSQAHQGKLYIDCEGATCVTDAGAIQNLIDNMTRADGTKIVTNVMLFTKDCGYKPIGNQLIGPEVEGNSLWYDSSVDYLIIIEPGKVKVYENNNFLPPFIIFSNSIQVEGVMGNILNNDFPDYSSKHQCMIVEG